MFKYFEPPWDSALTAAPSNRQFGKDLMQEGPKKTISVQNSISYHTASAE